MLFMRDLRRCRYCETAHNTTCFRVKPNTTCCGRVTVRGDIWRVGMSAPERRKELPAEGSGRKFL